MEAALSAAGLANLSFTSYSALIKAFGNGGLSEAQVLAIMGNVVHASAQQNLSASSLAALLENFDFNAS